MQRNIVQFSFAFLIASSASARFPTQIVDIDTAGIQGNGQALYPNGISDNGRIVAFMSEATNLVPGDQNAAFDIFVRDRSLATTALVSVASNGVQGNAPSRAPTASDRAGARKPTG